MNKRLKNGLKVMPDFCSSGIWDLKTGVMIDLDDDTIKLPADLQLEFNDWISYYDTCFEKDYSTMKPGKAKKLNAWGIKLAKKLKNILEGAQIEYQGEDKKHVLESVKI